MLLFLPGAQRRFAGLHMEVIDALAVAAMLSLSGAAATLLPAWRATRIPRPKSAAECKESPC